MNKVINYFDLGLFKSGEELKKAYNLFTEKKYNFQIFGFECCKEYYDLNEEIFKDYKNTNIYNLAVSDIDNKEIKLYYSKCIAGHTIYEDKNEAKFGGLTGTFEIVKTTKISNFINKENINILRMNIEGAEYNVIKDLINSNLLEHIDIILTVDWFKDITKIKSINMNDFNELIKNYNFIHINYAKKNWITELEKNIEYILCKN